MCKAYSALVTQSGIEEIIKELREKFPPSGSYKMSKSGNGEYSEIYQMKKEELENWLSTALRRCGEKVAGSVPMDGFFLCESRTAGCPRKTEIEEWQKQFLTPEK